ncbi:DNA polymerase IV [candidate division KSB1 bacterium]|nr:DNA polymerase IV [candidate division KSB1 bacterium]
MKFKTNNHKTILHIDLDAFFVEVERVLDKRLRRRPVVVCSDLSDRATVSAVSYEARTFRIRSGMLLPQAQRSCPEAVFLPENRDLYQDFSRKVYDIIHDVSPVTELASIDDYYADLSGCERIYHPFDDWAWKLKKTITGETGLPLSLGMGTNKLIARIATSQAKTNGLVQVLPGEEKKFIHPLSMIYLPGISLAIRSRLFEMGIKKIGELGHFPVSLLVKVLGKTGEDLHQRANGIYYEPVIEKSVTKEITQRADLPEDSADPQILEFHLCRLAGQLGFELRAAGLKTDRVTLRLTYSDLKEGAVTVNIATYTNFDHELFKAAKIALQKIFTRRVRVRRLMLSTPIMEVMDSQFNLFARNSQLKKKHLYGSIDRVRKRFGDNAIGFGVVIQPLSKFNTEKH